MGRRNSEAARVVGDDRVPGCSKEQMISISVDYAHPSVSVKHINIFSEGYSLYMHFPNRFVLFSTPGEFHS